MNFGRAAVAGISGGIAMTILGWIVRRMGVDMNSEMMLGTMLTIGGGAWIIGFAIHMMFSVGFALIYAWGFEKLVQRSGAVVGLGFAVVHIIVAGPAMALIPMVHPMIPEQMPSPGAFMANMGAAFVFVMEHLMYGAIVGALYGPIRQPVITRPLTKPTREYYEKHP